MAPIPLSEAGGQIRTARRGGQILLASGVMIGTHTSRLAAWQPTPGLGVVERINVYAYLLWVTVPSLTLLRRPPHR